MDPIIGTIFHWPVYWAPEGYFFCQGQQLQIRQYVALYSIIGVRFGGDGQNTFNLPDLRNCVPIGAGQGPGLMPYTIGMKNTGQANITLNTSQIPAHLHTLNSLTATATNTPAIQIPNLSSSASGFVFAGAAGNATTPAGNYLAQAPNVSVIPDNNSIYGTPNGSATIPVNASIAANQPFSLSSAAGSLKGGTDTTGSSTGHNNMQPYTVMNFIIAYEGLYPDFQ